MAFYQVMLVTTDGYDAMLDAIVVQQNMPEAQMELSKQLISGPFIPAMGVLWSIAIAAYLLHIRKHFFPTETPDANA